MPSGLRMLKQNGDHLAKLRFNAKVGHVIRVGGVLYVIDSVAVKERVCYAKPVMKIEK